MTKKNANKLILCIELALLIFSIFYVSKGGFTHNASDGFVSQMKDIFRGCFVLFMSFTSYITAKEIFSSDLNPLAHIINAVTICLVIISCTF